MILRALFFICAVALLAPREPDLGLGRPSTHIDTTGLTQFATQTLPDACIHDSCKVAPGAFDDAKGQIVARLLEVKAEIRADQRARGR